MVPKQRVLPSARQGIPSFPFVSGGGSFCTPTSSKYAPSPRYNPEQTHPADDLKSSPLFLVSGSRKRRRLHREDAEIFDSENEWLVPNASPPTPATPNFVYNGKLIYFK